MNLSPVGSSAYAYTAPTAQKPSAAATTAATQAVRPSAAGPVGADGDHDGDTAAGDRLDVRG
jgi:hypothetical protein